MSQKIGIFPASGALGTSILKHLAKIPVNDLVLICRKPEHLTGLKDAGAIVRKADYDDPRSIEGIFNGIDVLMLISYPSYEIDHRVQVHKLAIDSAVLSGVKHIFYSSLAFAGGIGNKSLSRVMAAHLATERYLSEHPGAFTYTSVRQGLYSESFPLYTAGFDLRNPVEEIWIPHSGLGPGIAWAKLDELGEATANLIMSYAINPTEFKFVDKLVLLSGPQELSLNETAAALGRVIGRPVRICEISLGYYGEKRNREEHHTYRGVDAEGELYKSTFDAIRAGDAAVVSPTLCELLGREPERFEETIRRMAGWPKI